tara:strand:- start:27005 stop:27109 length:105 start_codon:yes stop_codon:yes gene_type:complete
MGSLIWVLAICLIAVSTDVVDWLADKIEGKFRDK